MLTDMRKAFLGILGDARSRRCPARGFSTAVAPGCGATPSTGTAVPDRWPKSRYPALERFVGNVAAAAMMGHSGGSGC
jgi:hypothetical protein